MKALEGLKAMAIKPATPMPMEEESEAESPLMLAATDLLSAVKAGDAAGVADALEAAHRACGGMKGEGGEY